MADAAIAAEPKLWSLFRLRSQIRLFRAGGCKDARDDSEASLELTRENVRAESAAAWFEFLTTHRCAASGDLEVALERAREMRPDDVATGILLEQCRNLRERPVPDGWNGVIVMKQK